MNDKKLQPASGRFRFWFLPLIVALATNWICANTLHADLFDDSFGTNGLAILDENVQDQFKQFAVGPDGSVYVVGRTYVNHVDKWNVIIAKFDSNGELDPTFGGDGEVQLGFAGKDDEPHGIALQSDGKVLVLSRTDEYSYLSRYHTYGAPDNSFYPFGSFNRINLETATPLPPVEGPFSFPSFLAIGIKTWGDRTVVYSSSAVAVLSDNSLDNGFGYNGMVWPSLSFENGLKIKDVLFADDKIYLFGLTSDGGTSDVPSIFALNDDGTPFLNFGEGGVLIPPNGALEEATRFVYNNGLFTMAGGNRIVQMDADGILAGNLSIDGIVHLPEDVNVTDLVLQPYGRIAASVKLPNDEQGYESNKFAIVRLLPDGVPDHSFAFSTFGFATDGWFQMSYEEVATARQIFSYANGKILAVGDFKKNTGNESVLLLRLDSSNGGPVREILRRPGGLTTGG